ncbi:metallophosphoesterase [Halomarina ordinaria]|uniref:Metallophosphoesterase n=1 Tax=Halomarina ordinaria TaxID=3033939 RepID=A0ABD5U796_9EURY|nr:metallophosphoesterase [Halomarina sp. PSRA2]
MVAFRDRALSLPVADALVLADLHVGRAAASPVEFPLGERDDLEERLDALLAATSPGTVVLAGDVLHAFDRVPDGARGTVAALARLVETAGADLVVTPGNHDTMLDAVWDGPTEREYELADGTVVLHGHDPPERAAGRYVVGHDHPKLTVEGRDWPCLLYGEGVYEGADVFVLPAFTRLASGVSVNGRPGRASLERSPLVTDVDRFRPVVYDSAADEQRTFPPLGRLRRLR